MKIKELIKYTVLPLFIVLFYSLSFLDTKIDLKSTDSLFFLIIILVAVVFLTILVLLFFVLFAFFKKSEIPIIIFSVAIFGNCLFKVLLTSINTPLTISVSGDSELLTSLLLFYLAIGYFVFFIRYSLRIKDNRFLLFILIFAGLVFTFDFIYFGLYLYDLESGKGVLLYLSIGLFLLFSFIIIFSLPNSDYMEWKKDHKQLFLKSILIPWTLILFLSFMNFIAYPNQDASKEKKNTTPAFSMEKYKIKPKDGME
jgi:hypothetical protein